MYSVCCGLWALSGLFTQKPLTHKMLLAGHLCYFNVINTADWFCCLKAITSQDMMLSLPVVLWSARASPLSPSDDVKYSEVALQHSYLIWLTRTLKYYLLLQHTPTPSTFVFNLCNASVCFRVEWGIRGRQTDRQTDSWVTLCTWLPLKKTSLSLPRDWQLPVHYRCISEMTNFSDWCYLWPTVSITTSSKEWGGWFVCVWG